MNLFENSSYDSTQMVSSMNKQNECDCSQSNQCSCSTNNGKIEKIDSIIENLNKKLNKATADYSHSNMSHFATSLNGTTATTATISTGNLVKFQQPSKSLITSTVMNTDAVNQSHSVSRSSTSSSLTQSHLNINQNNLNTSALSSASSSASSIKDQYSPLKELKKSSKEYTISPYTLTNLNTITNVSPTKRVSPHSNATVSPSNQNTLDLQKSFASAITANYQPTSNSNSTLNPTISTSKLNEMFNKQYNNSKGNENSSSNSITAVSNNRSSYKINAPTSLAMTESIKPYPSINTSSLITRPMSKASSFKSTGSSTNVSSVSGSSVSSSRGSSASRNIQNSDFQSPMFNDYHYNTDGGVSPSLVNSQHMSEISNNTSLLSKKTSPPSSVTKSSFPSSATFNNSISTIKTSYPSYGYPNGTNNNNNNNRHYQPYSQVYSDYYRD